VDTLHVSDSGLLRWTPCMSKEIAIGVLLYKSTKSMSRALLRELRISGLCGMMTWTTKCLHVLLTWTLQLHVLVNLIVCDSALSSWTPCMFCLVNFNCM